MKKIIILLIAIGATLFMVACKEKKTSEDVAEDINKDRFEKKSDRMDADFVTEAMANSYDEVRLAEPAVEKATQSEVKNLAIEIRDEHNTMIKELKSLASEKSFSYPDSGSASISKTINDLSKEKGLEYDRKWLKEMEDLHQKDVRKYEDAAKNCSDSSLRNWAGLKLVKLRDHLDLIRKNKDAIK